MDLNQVFFLFCLCLRQLRGVCSDDLYYYSRSGEDATLTCDAVKPQGPNCSTVNWSYDGREIYNVYVVWEGKIQDSFRSFRLSRNLDCSLTVKNATEADIGKYFCGTWINFRYESLTYIYLSILSVFPAQPSFSQTSPETITLQCTLWRFHSLPPCEPDSLRWLDVNGLVLSGDGITQQNCQSNLTVKLQNPQLFTCQYLEEGSVLVSAEYSLEENSDSPVSQSLSSSTVYIVSAAVAVLLLLIVAAGLFFKMKHKRKTLKTTEDTEGTKHFSPALTDPENHVTYAVIDHHKPKAKKQVVEEDTVTYSAVKLQNTETFDHSAIYSQFEGVRTDSHLFFRAGENVTLPYQKEPNYGPECSEVSWFYYSSDMSQEVVLRVTGGSVLKESPGSSRVSLSSDCSLILHNVTEEDAGKYIYRVSDQRQHWDTTVYLGVMSVSPAPPTSGPNNNPSYLTIQCSVFRFSRRCIDGRIVWSDRNRKITSNVIQINCVSYLTVERRLSRTFTCRYFNSDNKPFVSADYTPEETTTEPTTLAPRGNRDECQESEPKGWWWFLLLLKALGWTGLIVATVVVSICTRENSITVPDYENQE
ncbi:hypothetical protein WMY93_025092 [Mugilogobius chulae]|uniref:Ig-like domain-containing protein n=1 Tax=Mugilogobius chulae TaxID=88201 RepID=A0AAW0N5V7_9GOBI